MIGDCSQDLGAVFQMFLRDQSDVLDDLRNALCGNRPIGTDQSDGLLDRFEQWLDERVDIANHTNRPALIQIAKAFIELVCEPDEGRSLVLA